MMTFDEGRIRIPGNNGFSTMPVRPGMTFDIEKMPVRPVRPGMTSDIETMPVRPWMTSDIEKMPVRPVRPGMTFDIETMPGKQNTDPGFDFLRSFIGQDQARTPSFDINQGQGALGRRSGEQLLRLQGGSG